MRMIAMWPPVRGVETTVNGASSRSTLADLVAARLETVDEELLPLPAVELPAPGLSEPARDHAQIASGLSIRVAVALENIEQHARGLRGRCAGQPHAL